jgi:UPF0755 protein
MASRGLSNLVNFILFGGALAAGCFLTYKLLGDFILNPADPDAQEQSFIVEPGWGLNKIASKLEEKKIVKNKHSLSVLSQFMKGPDGKKLSEAKIHPGEYKMSPAKTPKELLNNLAEANIVYHEFSIPEGSTLKQIAKKMAATTLCTEEEANRHFNSPVVVDQFGIPASTVEGYVYPSTYKFTKPDNARTMIEQMIKEGQKLRTEDLERRAHELGLTWHNVLTLASIIEKETGKSSERKIISSVFHNRISIQMPLQTDPTVIYGIPNFDGNLTKQHLKTPGPYNTYLNTGLPPTPIASPGEEAIDAALYPADTEYLFFVSKNDGTHQFSVTYADHTKAVNQYQKGKVTPEPTKKKKKKKVVKKVKKVEKEVEKKVKKVEKKVEGQAKPKNNQGKLKRKKGPLSQLELEF